MRGLILIFLWLPCSAWAVQDYDFRVLEKRPHSRGDFVQGLELRDGNLYQGTGGYGKSRLQVFEFSNNKLLREKQLPRKYFGEGITVMDERIFLLTWRARRGFVFRRTDLALLGEFELPGEGWGLTNDGQRLILSDGSHRLQFLSPENGEQQGWLTVTDEGKPVKFLNELEWTPQYLLANVWFSNKVLMIDLANGQVIGRIDLSGLLPEEERRPGTDVLNGIARDPESGELWFTGKNWPWIYRIELLRQSGLE